MATASTPQVIIGTRVLVKDRNVRGTIRFSGTTQFSAGRWIGVELDEAVGKNNGSVAGRFYFLCDNEHGIFVRQNQIDLLSGSDTWSAATPPVLSPPKDLEIPSKAPLLSSSVTPMKERSKSLLVTPKAGYDKKTTDSPVSSPRARRKVVPKAAGTGQRQLMDPGSKLKTGLEESAVGESSPLLQLDEDVPEPWRSVIRDLNSKVDTLKMKRQDDRMKIKEGEKSKLQIQQLMEQKTHILELQGRIQVELKNSQKETRSLQEQRAVLQKRLQEVGEMVELLTVDKELAEERAEALHTELSSSRDKVEELSLDLEILQEEIRQSGPGVPVASVAMKQMDQQNNRLKEALVKVRDLLTTEQQGHKEAMKELEKERISVENLTKEKDSYKHQVEESEETIDLLKEQVDLNISSERMIEVLSDRNLDLEDQLITLRESLDDMEALKEIHDELEENQLAMERELREDLDIEMNKKHQTETRLEQAQLTIADYQDTVEKFRNLVSTLQKDLSESRREQETERSSREQLASQSQAMLSLNLSLKASVTKGHSKAVDLELQKLDAVQAKKQVELLLQFLPNSFYTEGGEHDCVSLVVLLLRLQFKVQLLLDQLRQQYQLEKYFDKRVAILPQQAEQIVYVSKLGLQVHKLGRLVSKLMRMLETCGGDKLRELGGKVQDMSVHERSIDGLLDLYRQDQLDNAVQLDTLNRAISHIQILTADTIELPADCHYFLSDVLSHIKQIEEVNIIYMCCLKSYVQPEGEFISMLKGIETLSVDFMIYCGRLSRKIPVDAKGVKFYVSEEQIAKLQHYMDVSLKSCNALENGLSDIQEESSTAGEVVGLRDSPAHRLFNKAINREFGSTGSEKSISTSYQEGINLFKEMIESIQAGTYDKSPPGDRPQNPLTNRASEVKSHLSDAEGLRDKLEEKEGEILEVKKSNAIKTQDLRNSQVKIDMVDSKLDSLKKEYTETLSTKSEKILVIEHELLEMKENHEQTVKTLESDLSNFETENKQLKRSLEAAKRSESFCPPLHEVVRRSSSQHVDDESAMLIMHQNKVLKSALNNATAETSVLKRRLMNEQLRDLKPLVACPIISKDEENKSDSEKSLYKQFSRVKNEICQLEACPQVVDITTGSKGIQAYCQKQVDKSIKKSQLARECNDLRQRISLLAASQHSGALIQTETSSFIDPNYAKSLECRKVGAIRVPTSQGISRNITTRVDAEIVQKLLSLTL